MKVNLCPFLHILLNIQNAPRGFTLTRLKTTTFTLISTVLENILKIGFYVISLVNFDDR